MINSNFLDTTVDEWRAAMNEYLELTSEGETIPELAQKLGISESTMRRRLRKMLESGQCTQGRGTRNDALGRSFVVAVYQLTPKKKANNQ